jgi:lipopolysaccharide/colanic/teichoic acid biosynthesis glycosyltransferase
MLEGIPNPAQIRKIDFSVLEKGYEPESLNGNKRSFNLVKRLMDVVIAGAALVVFFPFLLLLGIMIRLDSAGPAIFSHMRVGYGGKLFRLYKFRTMRSGVGAQEFAPAKKGDPRVTRMGRFLRRTSLDELPQFWNVLKGDMSLVGPRPEMEFIVKKYTPLQKCRLVVKPGLTGLWQVLGRKDLPLHENAEYDYYYILHMSLFLDLQIILKTIIVVISGKGAY